ncbi:hypothetical protein [Mycoplasma hafezii]|uniref:hypothetical protein n=1 Tax=Mycoplasma hafezii TaxID=525886 RepID=UPI003CEDB38F
MKKEKLNMHNFAILVFNIFFLLLILVGIYNILFFGISDIVDWRPRRNYTPGDGSAFTNIVMCVFSIICYIPFIVGLWITQFVILKLKGNSILQSLFPIFYIKKEFKNEFSSKKSLLISYIILIICFSVTFLGLYLSLLILPALANGVYNLMSFFANAIFIPTGYFAPLLVAIGLLIAMLVDLKLSHYKAKAKL